MPNLSSKQWIIAIAALILTLILGIIMGYTSTSYYRSASAQDEPMCTNQDYQYNQSLSNPLFYSQRGQVVGLIANVNGNILTIRNRVMFARDVESSAGLDQIVLGKLAIIDIQLVGCRLKVVSIKYI